jgi:hypothetical protein
MISADQKFKILRSLVSDREMRRPEIAVAAVLLDQVDSAGVATATYLELASKICQSTRLAQGATQRLTAAGLFEKISGRGGLPNQYVIGGDFSVEVPTT